MQAGAKRVCPPMDRAEGARERPQCVTRSGVHNIAVHFPSSPQSCQIGILTLPTL